MRSRALGLLISITIVASVLFAAPSAAKQKRACKPWRPQILAEWEAPEVANLPVMKVTDEATAREPITIEYEHGPTVDYAGATLNTDEEWFNFQIDSKRRWVGLYVRIEWPTPSLSDIDMYVIDQYGENIAWSEWFNNPVIDEAYNLAFPNYSGGHGGMGFEYIRGREVRDCLGVHFVSSASLTAGEHVVLKVWLGRPRPDW